MTLAAPDERRALREAAAWYVRLRDTTATDHAQQDWQRWHSADPAHQRAWQRVQSVNAQLSLIPAPLARKTLSGPNGRSSASRRNLLRSLAIGMGAGTTAWLSWQGMPWREWQATHRTSTGERLDITLPDGSQLTLDTASAVDVRFDDRQRRLQLHSGRILVSTQPDPLGRPFSVQTPQGQVLARGTRFTVQLEANGYCQVHVEEKIVELQPLAGPVQALHAGEQARFSRDAAQAPQDSSPFATSWHQGGLVALDMPLGELIDALARYRPGYLGCAPEVAQMRVSGAFPIDETDRALAALVSRFPLQLLRRTRYWVQVQAL